MGGQKRLDLTAIRRDYGALTLDEHDLDPCPLAQCRRWLAQALEAELDDPTAMVLSTVDDHGYPDGRVVLLKTITADGFVFYTHYDSMKGQQINTNPHVALTLFWPMLVRQIRIRGEAFKIAPAASDAYFAARPYLSQLSAIASLQSHPLANRATLEAQVETLKHQYPEGKVPRPKDWGGYEVRPLQVEFWQGRDNRFHDRMRYTQKDHQWQQIRLAP